MSFETLGLSPKLLRAVKEEGYSTPTPIQNKAIPVILEGKDILAAAQTGTGKTAGFTLPMLHRLSLETPAKKRKIKALVLTPTRELAAQVSDSIKTYGKHLPLQSMVVFGGVGINPQIKRLESGVDILVATPGRLLDLVNQKKADLSEVMFFVLDEADRMLDMGFIHDIRKVIKLLPNKRQNLLFSATFSPEIKKLANTFLQSPVLVEVARQNSTSSQVSQAVHFVTKEEKRAHISHHIGKNRWEQVLIFTRTKHGADRLSKQLVKDGLSATAIHGNKSQGARTKALDAFKSGKISILVATDIAARGLDIDKLPYVVNFELPQVAEDYVHRIGRTGRAGNEGVALSLVCDEEMKLLKGIESLIKTKIPSQHGSIPREPQSTKEPVKRRRRPTSRARQERSRTQSR